MFTGRLQCTVLETSHLLSKLIFIIPWDFGTRNFMVTKRMQILGPSFVSVPLSLIFKEMFAYSRN